MKQSLRLGRVAGIPVGVNWSVLVILVLITDIVAGNVLPRADAGRSASVYWAIAIPTAVLFLASLLAHEGAHAAVARRKGLGVRSITLWMLGGVAQLDGEPSNARADLAISAAGPVTSLAIGVVLFACAEASALFGAPATVVAALAWTGATNAFLAVFNLLPGAPLDGGRILRALVWMRSGDRSRGDRVATGAGQIMGAGLAGAGVAQLIFLGQSGGLWLMLIGWFLVWAAGAEAKARAVREAASDVHIRELMVPEPECAAAWRPVGEFIASVAAHSRRSVFPVTGFDGRPCGVVTLARLSRVPATRAAERVDSVAVALPPDYTAGPDDPVSSLVGRAPLANALLAVVVADGRVVGMVTTEDVDRLVQQSMLRAGGPPLAEPRRPTAGGASR
ncbi:site-2 protease family protein [Actinomadura sp. DC4]|uniref:site-2 protease family protein n=1 Tax=Actinomadura sp. DC4 TaxID=3055069 RepID=UPI0025B1310E|nr:site-2 protease family protein [Actinomadura sp. DC4]MDN3355170.1 site-2 protease family protein [Actinomadura sp. DC4]